jgi:hypothetical protein
MIYPHVTVVLDREAWNMEVLLQRKRNPRKMLQPQSIILALGLTSAALDGVFTYIVINAGGYELNPIIRLLVRRTSVTSTVLLTRLAIFGLLLTFWLLSDTILVVSCFLVTSSAAAFTAKSIVALRS